MRCFASWEQKISTHAMDATMLSVQHMWHPVLGLCEAARTPLERKLGVAHRLCNAASRFIQASECSGHSSPVMCITDRLLQISVGRNFPLTRFQLHSRPYMSRDCAPAPHLGRIRPASLARSETLWARKRMNAPTAPTRFPFQKEQLDVKVQGSNGLESRSRR